MGAAELRVCEGQSTKRGGRLGRGRRPCHAPRSPPTAPDVGAALSCRATVRPSNCCNCYCARISPVASGVSLRAAPNHSCGDNASTAPESAHTTASRPTPQPMRRPMCCALLRKACGGLSLPLRTASGIARRGARAERPGHMCSLVLCICSCLGERSFLLAWQRRRFQRDL